MSASALLALLSLGAAGGDTVVLASDAEDADQALDRLAKLVQEGMDEIPPA